MPEKSQSSRVVSYTALLLGMERIEESEEHSDVIIRGVFDGGSVEYKRHKVILGPRSTWSATACRENRFMEGEAAIITTSLSKKSEFDEDADNAEAFDNMMQFLYLSYYDDSDQDTVSGHAMVYAIAEKYGVASLARLAYERYADCWSKKPSDQDIACAVKFVNESVAPQATGLEHVTAERVAHYFSHLIQVDEIRRVLERTPEFSVLLMQELQKQDLLKFHRSPQEDIPEAETPENEGRKRKR